MPSTRPKGRASPKESNLRGVSLGDGMQNHHATAIDSKGIQNTSADRGANSDHQIPLPYSNHVRNATYQMAGSASDSAVNRTNLASKCLAGFRLLRVVDIPDFAA